MAQIQSRTRTPGRDSGTDPNLADELEGDQATFFENDPPAKTLQIDRSPPRRRRVPSTLLKVVAVLVVLAIIGVAVVQYGIPYARHAYRQEILSVQKGAAVQATEANKKAFDERVGAVETMMDSAAANSAEALKQAKAAKRDLEKVQLTADSADAKVEALTGVVAWHTTQIAEEKSITRHLVRVVEKIRVKQGISECLFGAACEQNLVGIPSAEEILGRGPAQQATTDDPDPDPPAEGDQN